MTIFYGNAIDLVSECGELDMIGTDPPYAFGGSGDEHALSAAVAVVLRESAAALRRGSWMVVFSASSWRSINYIVEATRGIVAPVRIATWTKPKSRTRVKTVGWEWGSVSVIALRKGPKNRDGLPSCVDLDHICEPPVIHGRRAQLPDVVADWAIAPFTVQGGRFLDPFAGSGALVSAAERAGMRAIGFEKNSPDGFPLPTEGVGR